MTSFLTITQVIFSILLIILVLLQNKNVSLNLTSMGGGMGEITKRGPEKVLHIATIIIASLFAANAIALFLLK